MLEVTPLQSAVILAGGQGIRLKPLSDQMPKPMVPILGRPMIAWIVEWLRNNGVKRVVIGVAYKKEVVKKYFHDWSNDEFFVQFSEHTVDGGTAEGFNLAVSRYVRDEDFFALNGDQITDLNLKELANYHLRSKKKPLATIVVVKPKLPFGRVILNKNKVIRAFLEKPESPFYCSAGIYIFNRGILDYIPRKGDIERTTFPKLASASAIKAYIYNGKFITVNTLKDLEEAERQLKNE